MREPSWIEGKRKREGGGWTWSASRKQRRRADVDRSAEAAAAALHLRLLESTAGRLQLLPCCLCTSAAAARARPIHQPSAPARLPDVSAAIGCPPVCVVSTLFPVQSVDINMNYFLETLRALNLKKLGSPPAERSMDISALEKALRFINMRKDDLPAAVHSVVIRTPSGTARTHRFATQTVNLPAQEGERVTISLAAPSNVYRDMGPLKIAARSQGFKPGEPMCLTNHINAQVSKLLRAPSKNEGTFFLSPYLLVGALAFIASADAASTFIDPSLPRLVTATAIASAVVGTTLNEVVLPRIRKLPRKAVDIVAVRQKLLSQYDIIQSRLKELKQCAQKEVWMLARMCQLDNKIVAVGEPSYRARRGRLRRVRESLESTLLARIELMESYAKLCSMIEIEVEMDSGVIAAEAASSAERISEQIQQLMEIDSLEKQWRIQAEANDEAERLLSSDSSETFPAGRVM